MLAQVCDQWDANLMCNYISLDFVEEVNMVPNPLTNLDGPIPNYG